MMIANKVKCNSCSSEEIYSEDKRVGSWAGEPDIYDLLEELEDIEELESGKEYDKLWELLRFHNAKITGFIENRYHRCPLCNTLYYVFHYEVTYGKDEIYTKPHKCDKCESQLISLPFDAQPEFSDYNCKKCGKKTMLSLGEVLLE